MRKIIGQTCLIMAIIVFFPYLGLEIHEPSKRHLWDLIGVIAMVIVSISLIREKK